jgi:serine phosphatase RsbU (regulator of sigma subunit)
VWIHFTPFLPERYVSAVDVIAGRVNPQLLKHKLVLIGLTGQGLGDIVTTPRGERIPGLEVHAQLLENIFDQSLLTRPYWMSGIELALLLALGLLLIQLVPQVTPRLSTLLAMALLGAVLILSVLLYQMAELLLDAATVFVGGGSCYISLIFSSFIIADRERRAAEQALQREREHAARVAGEMDAAKRIQMGSLPRPEVAFPDERRFDLAVLLEPARVVGGDLYDFYKLDANRLFFIVGDVAGKGLPASLFMVVTKAIAKSVALQGRLSVSGILERMNRELNWENPEMLFVTAFAGILDIVHGELEYCIAGHDAPWRLAAAGGIEQLAGEGQPGLCMMDEVHYRMQKVSLQPGDALCVVTDGVTEAMSTAGELYGRARVTAALQSKGASSAAAAELLKRLRDDVQGHVGDAEPSDDLTVLILRWNGAGELQ